MGHKSGSQQKKLRLRVPEFAAKIRTRKPWRRGWDSNPRYPCEYAAFRVRCFRPLSHLSGHIGRRIVCAGCLIAATPPPCKSECDGFFNPFRKLPAVCPKHWKMAGQLIPRASEAKASRQRRKPSRRIQQQKNVHSMVFLEASRNPETIKHRSSKRSKSEMIMSFASAPPPRLFQFLPLAVSRSRPLGT